MKSLTVLIISLSFLTATYAQQQAIKITNEVSKKEKIIKENKRVILTTKDGQRIKGRLMLGDNNTVVVDGVKIRLTDIDQLKRNPFSTSILTSEILVDDMVETSGLWLVIPAAAIIYTGIKSPNFNKNFETDKGWQFEVITIPE
jgi:small nuclear ribonucleoprotein (snRNP)-like protein